MASTTAASKKRKHSTNPKPRKAKVKSSAVECPICLSPTKPSQMIQISTCNCQCCKSCLREAFEVGLTPSNFPARCCGYPLDLDAHEKHLKATTRRAYRCKVEEHQDNNPLYCAGCREYLLDSSRKDKFATCGMCHMKTCTQCTKLKTAHLGIHSMCPRDTDDLFDLAKEKGWQRCPRCFCLVEKASGCNEIRCICKAYFCYRCGMLKEASTRDDADKCVCQDRANVEDSPTEATRPNTQSDDDDLPESRELLRPPRQPSALPAEFPD